MTRGRLVLPPPPTLGFPAKFSAYRPTQTQGVFDVTEARRRARILNMPTGCGKTLTALTILLLEQARGLILTSTKALEDFYLDVGRSVGLMDIRGASNYRCPALEPHGDYAHLRGHRSATADNGPCLSGMPCRLKSDGCPKYDALRAAQSAQLVVSNYDYWITSGKGIMQRGETDSSEGLGSFDYLIMDELHDAESHVQKALHIDLDVGFVRSLIRREPLSASTSVEQWREWGRAARVEVAVGLDRIARELRLTHEDIGASGVSGVSGSVDQELLDDLREHRALDRVLRDLTEMHGRWVVDGSGGGGLGKILSFDPVWVDGYTERMLFRGTPVVVGMSATIVPAMLRYLGISEGSYDFFEYPSPFDIRRRPIYFWPVVRMHYGMTDREKRVWAAGIDKLLDARRSWRTLAHSVSYKRARELHQLSAHSAEFILHDPRSTKEAVERFRRSPPPVTLVSPSVGTGWDFPDDDARTIILTKTPYPSMESAVMRARVEMDKGYGDVYAATESAQALGRHVRSERDWGEGVIVDTAFGGLMSEKKFKLLPKWLRQAMKWVRDVPRPMKLTNEGRL